MNPLHFNFKDIFRAARLGFSVQRIWTNAVGLLAGYLVYLLFSYLGIMAGGFSFGHIWNQLGLLPCAFAVNVSGFGMLIYIVGMAISLFIILITNTAVSRVVYMVLRNELFYSWIQAFKFALNKWISIVGAIFTFVFIIAFFVIGAFIMGLIGRIPFLGEIGTAFLTFPYILSTLFLLFISIVFVVGLFFIPAIMATSDEDALGAVFQSFSITFNQPWRIVVYGSITALLEFSAIIIFAIFLKFSYKIFLLLFSVGMGEKIADLNSFALHIVDQSLPALYGWFHSLPANIGDLVYLMNPHPAAPLMSAPMMLSGAILAIFMLMLMGLAIAYGEAVGNSGLTIIYIILYKKHENENLLEREDEELKEEEEENEAPAIPPDVNPSSGEDETKNQEESK